MEYADFIRERRLIQAQEAKFAEAAIEYAGTRTQDQIDGVILGEITIVVYGRRSDRAWSSEIPVSDFVEWMKRRGCAT